MKNPRILLIGIGGVYNYGCEAIVRGTELMLHEQWPDAKIVYASYRPDDDRARLKDCNVEIIERKRIGRYSSSNIIRKCLSIMGIAWQPTTDPPSVAGGSDAVLSIGGDIYTIRPGGNYPAGFMRFGDGCEKKGMPYVLWGASVGPFSEKLNVEKAVRKHLKRITLITARESKTVDYLQSLNVCDNVISCADPAYVVAPEIKVNQISNGNNPTIGINLSPLSVLYTNYSLEEAIHSQAIAIENLIKSFNAKILLVPHVVCDFNEADDDRRYLGKVKQAIATKYQKSVSMLDNDPGFVGTKKELTKCNMVIAVRMHCAINALSAHIPTIIVSYSQKAVGMCQYVYDSSDWVIPIDQFTSEYVLGNKVRAMLEQASVIKNYLALRIIEIQKDAYHPMQRLKSLVEKQ